MNRLPAYPHLDGLVDLARRDGVDIRPTLLRVLTDLYVQKPTHSALEEAQYLELALGLVDAVDEPTRAAVAASLARYPAAPAAILRKLGAPERAPLPAVEPAPVSPADMFFAAASDERRLMLENLESPAAAAHRPAPASSEVVRRLENAALQHNAGEFGRILERALGVSRALADRITRDQSGEPLVVAARAIGMNASVFQRVLLFLNPAIGQSVGQVHDLARLFDDLRPEAAERMVSIWRQGAKPAVPAHEAALWDDERRSARSLSTPAPRRSVTGRDEQPSRFKTTGR
jgi:uncharacterized protein (DUF2336 family)